MTKLSYFFGFLDDLRLLWLNTVIDGILEGTPLRDSIQGQFKENHH